MLSCLMIMLIILIPLLLPGCTTEKLTRGLYDGIKVRNDLQSSPAERYGKPEAPDYQEQKAKGSALDIGHIN